MMNKKNIKKDYLIFFASIFILFIAWKIISLIIDSEIIFPSPESTFIGVTEVARQDDFLGAVFHSITRGLIGFAISFLSGIVLGITTGFSKILYKLMEPVLVIIKSIPLISIILISLIWFDSENVPIFASFLVSFPIVYTNVVEGVKNIDKKILEMAKSFRAKKIRILMEIYIPAILPFIIAAAVSSVGIGWKAVIAAEVLSNPLKAIGTNMQLSKIYLETDKVIAWTVIAILISYFFELFIKLIGKKIIKWKY
jgi:NitT/TauT family transport system permease protein